MKRRLKLFLAASLFVVPCQSLHAQITLNQRNTTVKAVIQRIQKQTKYKFFYDDAIGRTSVQNIKVDNATLNSTLTRLFSGKDITWTTEDNIVYLRRNNTAQPKPGQKGKKDDPDKKAVVTGTVVDANGDPVIGASVSVNGTTGAITDINGHYVVNAAPGDEVAVSFVGFEQQHAKAGRHNNLDFTMREDQQALNEVVVVGFGTQKKIDLTGAVSTISGKELANRPTRTVVQALQGLVPGLSISAMNGEIGTTGSNMSISIRGTGTIGQGSNGGPLVLIDGIEGDMSAINPDDIDNISVLKDAAASSIYGSRAPFGVILITTKNGDHGGKTRINYNNSFRFSNFIRKKRMINSVQFASMINDANINSGRSVWYNKERVDRIVAYHNATPVSPGVRRTADGELVYSLYPSTTVPQYWGSIWVEGSDDTDWQDEYYNNTAFAQEHNVSISGGSKAFNYYTSFSFLDNDGFLRIGSDNYRRLTGMAKITASVTSWLQLVYNMNYRHIYTARPTFLNSDFYASNLRQGWPTLPKYDRNGHKFPGGDTMYTRLAWGGQSTNERDITTHQIELIFEPVKKWITHVDFSYQLGNTTSQAVSKYTYDWDVAGNKKIAKQDSYDQESEDKTKYYNFQVWSEYTFNLAEKHNIHVMAGFQAEQQKSLSFSEQRAGLLDPDKTEISLTSGLNYIGQVVAPYLTGARQQWQTAGFFGRVNYNFMERYLFETNLRYDGSSRFRSDKRWRAFPSASVGWRITEEPFMKATRAWIDNLKVRISYGMIGNQNTSNLYPTYQLITYQPAAGGWLLNGNRPNIVTAPNLVSTTLGWENVITYDTGLDLALLNNRLSVTLDYYIRDTKDMVGNAPALPDILGTSVPVTNNTDLRTRGWELEVGWHDKLKNGFYYSIKGNISDARTKITRYPNNPTQSIWNYIAGQYTGNIWGYQTIGIARNDEEMETHLKKVNQSSYGSYWAAGDIMYADLDGDGRLSAGGQTLTNHGDLKIIGNSTPRYLFGVDINAAWKGFDFRAFFQGVGKRDYWTDMTEFLFGANGKGLWFLAGIRETYDYFRDDNTWSVQNGYQQANKDAWLPRVAFSNKNLQTQTRYLLNAAYMRLKNLQLGYTVPRSITQRWKIDNLRIFFSADNVFTITDMPKQFDPEMMGTGASRSNGYPLSKTFSFGLNVTL